MNPSAMFILSSDYEGIANVLLEALCAAIEKLTYAKRLVYKALQIREKLTSQEVFVSWYRYLFEEEPKEL